MKIYEKYDKNIIANANFDVVLHVDTSYLDLKV